jgi:hypothetical protein
MPSTAVCGGCGGGHWRLRHRRSGGSGARSGGPDVVEDPVWWWLTGGGPYRVVSFCFFSYVCRACQRSMANTSLFVVRLQSRRTAKPAAAVANGLCHTRFSEENQVLPICMPGSSFIHVVTS